MNGQVQFRHLDRRPANGQFAAAIQSEGLLKEKGRQAALIRLAGLICRPDG